MAAPAFKGLIFLVSETCSFFLKAVFHIKTMRTEGLSSSSHLDDHIIYCMTRTLHNGMVVLIITQGEEV